jgi:hypothetical protein
MKRIILAAMLLAASGEAHAAMIFARHAREHVGAVETIRGVVAGIHDDGRQVRLYLDRRYPRNSLTVVIAPAAMGIFPNADTYAGKTVDVSGIIRMEGAIPQIVVRDRRQLYVKD